MNFNQLRQHMPALLRSGISLELVSAPGLGKSDFVADTVADLSRADGEEWGFVTMFLATQTPVDMIGYVFKGQMEYNGKQLPISEPTLPLWMVTNSGKPTYAYKRGVLFLDEYGQGEADTKRASAQLLLKKELGPWKLGGENQAGWSVVAASNRSTDRSGVTKSFDFIINRRMEIHITPDLVAWKDWAEAHGVMGLTIVFADQNPQIVFNDKVPDKQEPWCTPRSLCMADKLLQTLSGGDEDNIPMGPEAVELVGGIIGAGSAAQYFNFVRLKREMPKYESIVKNPTTVKVPEKPDAQMLVCYNLAHRVEAEDCAPVIKYIERMPKEFAVTFAKAACKRKPGLVTTPAFTKWAMENSSLMAAIAKN